MSEPIIFKGYWWLPDNPEDKVAGVLTCIPHESIVLELIGSFNSDKKSSIEVFLDSKEEPLIYGIESGAKEITLIRCYRSLSYNFDCPFPMVRYTAGYLVYDKHVKGLDERCNYKAIVKFPELSYWCFPNVLKKIFSNHTGRTELQVIQFVRLDEETETIASSTLEDGTQLSIKQNALYRDGEFGLRPDIQQYTYLELHNPAGLTLRNMYGLVRRFKSFLSLATFRSVHYSEFTLLDPDICQVFSGGKRHFFPIKIYDSFSINDNPSKISVINFLFSFKTIKDSFGTLIKNWMSTTDNMIPIKNHLAESIVYKKVFSSVDFLIVVQAIEGFWWRFREEAYRKSNNIRKKDKTHLNTILTELIEEFRDITAIGELDLDVKAVVDSRHYYSHFVDKASKPATLDGVELLFLTRKLRVLLICCVLSFIGMKHEMLDAIFRDCNNEELSYEKESSI